VFCRQLVLTRRRLCCRLGEADVKLITIGERAAGASKALVHRRLPHKRAAILSRVEPRRSRRSLRFMAQHQASGRQDLPAD
jgi:hypothetical protein